jgi:hypothetical protein
MNSRPNILVIQADQLAARYLGAYRNPIASTPNIDSLAANGAILDSAYTNFPLCAPSRFTNDVVTVTYAGVCLRNVQLEYGDEVCHRVLQK